MDEIDSLITLKFGPIPRSGDGMLMMAYIRTLPEYFQCRYGYRHSSSTSLTKKSLFAKVDEVKADLQRYMAEQLV